MLQLANDIQQLEEPIGPTRRRPDRSFERDLARKRKTGGGGSGRTGSRNAENFNAPLDEHERTSGGERTAEAVRGLHAIAPPGGRLARCAASSAEVGSACPTALTGATHRCDQVLNESSGHNVPKGSETHFKVVVISDAFDGQKLIARHRMVNSILADELSG